MADISVIIVNWNTQELLAACLDSVFSEGSSVDLEVIVVDNGSTDGSVEMVRSRFPQVRLQVNAANEKFAGPNNDGMRASSGRYLLLLNSDVEIRAGAIRTMKEYLDTHPEAGTCSPKILYPDGRLQRSVCGFHTPWTHACDMTLLDKIFPRSLFFARGVMATYPYDEQIIQSVESIMGAAFMVRRGVLETTGPFDERLSIYYNEMDWFLRMNRDGWKVVYLPSAVVVHHGGRTTARVSMDAEIIREMYENVSWYFYKHYGRTGLLLHKIFLVVGFVPRAIGWGIRRLIRPSDRADVMFRFSVMSLATGLRLLSRPR